MSEKAPGVVGGIPADSYKHSGKMLSEMLTTVNMANGGGGGQCLKISRMPPLCTSRSIREKETRPYEAM